MHLMTATSATRSNTTCSRISIQWLRRGRTAGPGSVRALRPAVRERPAPEAVQYAQVVRKIVRMSLPGGGRPVLAQAVSAPAGARGLAQSPDMSGGVRPRPHRSQRLSTNRLGDGGLRDSLRVSSSPVSDFRSFSLARDGPGKGQ
jgi:hypothetical protein